MVLIMEKQKDGGDESFAEGAARTRRIWTGQAPKDIFAITPRVTPSGQAGTARASLLPDEGILFC